MQPLKFDLIKKWKPQSNDRPKLEMLLVPYPKPVGTRVKAENLTWNQINKHFLSTAWVELIIIWKIPQYLSTPKQGYDAQKCTTVDVSGSHRAMALGVLL